MSKEIQFAGLTFKGLTKENVLSSSSSIKHIVTVNAEFIVEANVNNRLRNLINNNCSTFDGQIPFIIAKLKNRNVAIEKLSGSDLIYDIANLCKIKDQKMFLLGGRKISNDKASEVLRQKYGIKSEGYSPPMLDYPFSPKHNDEILARIAIFQPDFVLVGFGAGKQEYWIDDNKAELEKMGVKYVMGCGGAFEMVAGILPRAPKFMQQIGLEGIYRFFIQPNGIRFRRLLKSLKLFQYI